MKIGFFDNGTWFSMTWGMHDYCWIQIHWEARKGLIEYRKLKIPYRRYGLERDWYDGPITSLHLGPIVIVWSHNHTLPPHEFLSDEAKKKWSRKPDWWRKFRAMEEYRMEILIQSEL